MIWNFMTVGKRRMVSLPYVTVYYRIVSYGNLPYLTIRTLTRVYSNSEAYELLMSGDVIVACGRFNCLAGLCGRATKRNSLLGLLCALPVVDCYFCARLFVYCGSVFFFLFTFFGSGDRISAVTYGRCRRRVGSCFSLCRVYSLDV